MKGILIILFVLALTIPVSADSLFYPPERTTTEHRFGSTKILLHYDSVQSPFYPKYSLEVRRGSRMIAKHTDVGFEEVFSSSSHRFFLVVSNLGTAPPAAVVFNEQGTIMLLVPFGDARLSYCFRSVSVMRQWYDGTNPDVEFVTNGDELVEVRINGCDGRRATLSITSTGHEEQDSDANKGELVSRLARPPVQRDSTSIR
jgi:hypothetical protein